MATDMMPRTATPRQPPGRGAQPVRGTPSGRTTFAPKAPHAPKDPRNPRDLRTRPITAPRHTKPSAKPSDKPSPRPAAAGYRTRSRQPRAPFILLLVGLLGGALVSLLVISTTLAQGSYQITRLQQQNTNLARQEQILTQQVAQASSPAQIASEAEQFGMQQNPNLRFINLKTGKIIQGKVSSADAALYAPGYTP
jgi:cell division protein FtsL